MSVSVCSLQKCLTHETNYTAALKKKKITCKCLYLSGKVYKCMSKAKIVIKRGQYKPYKIYTHKGVSGWVDFGTSEVLG